MNKRTVLSVLILVVLGAFILYRVSQNQSQQQPQGAAKPKIPAQVTGIVLQATTFADNLSLSGSLEANEQVEIRSEVSGVVESINFNEGSKVSKGQVLFKVNDLELQAQLAKTRTAEQLASENARRAKLLLDKEAISREEFDIATADYRAAQSQSKLIRAQLDKTIIRAPFSGTIGLRSISRGTYLTPQTVVAKLVNLEQLKLTFSIPEKYAPQMKTGTSLTFTVSGAADQHSAKVYAIEPEIETATRTLRLRAVADNTQGRLIPGTFANVTLPLEKTDQALMVPTQALIPIQNGKKIFVAKGSVAKEIIVETGARTQNDILITKGLKAGDTVLTTGVMSLRDGAPVSVRIIGKTPGQS
jgi:membrane fusion protein, multidrug efflux system